MASAGASAVGSASLLVPVFGPLSVAAVAYTGHRFVHLDWRHLFSRFFTGPGRVSRILLLVFVLTIRKNMIFVWTARVFGAMLRHVIRPRQPLPPKAIFHYAITQSRAPLLECDYNFHKSNSTYFTDLDVSRSHLCMHLLGPGMKSVSKRQTIIRDKDGNEVKGKFGVALGSVFCSWKKEIPPYRGYEMWSRVLGWDRKWLTMVTYFVDKDKVRPASYHDGSGGGWFSSAPKTVGSGAEKDEDFQKHVFATAVSRYVFKKGRFTIHPTILLEAADLLPERPGEGWRGGESETGTPDALSDLDEAPAEWDWRNVESMRREGMVFADHFAALDGLHTRFEGGREGVLGRFSPG